MSLRVWLPLTGDLSNSGLSTATVTNTGATVDTGGKIGSCYSFTTSRLIQAALAQPITSLINSVACWVKFNAFPSSGQYLCLLKVGGVGSGYGAGVLCLWLESGVIYVNIKGSDPAGADKINHTLTTGVWYHIAATYDGATAKIYLNGTEIYSKVLTKSGTLSTISCFLVGASNAGTIASPSPNYGLNGYINDARFYDHCLSSKEVEELARGLVLHYKLSDSSVEGTTNLCSTGASGWNNSGTCVRTANDTSILFPPTKSNTYSIRATSDGSMAAQIGLTPASHPSKTIVASTWVWLDGTQDSSSFYLRSVKTDGSVGYLMYKGQSNPTLWPQRQWVRIATDPIATAADATTFYICTYVNKNTEVRAFNGWQIEAKDHPTAWTPPGTTRAFNPRMCDCSGYKHHGALNDTSIVVSADTARYTSSLKNGQAYNSGTYPLSGPLVLNNIDQITISLWARPTTMGHQDSGIFSTTAASLPTDYQTTVCNHYDGYLACCNTSGTVVRLNVGGQFTLNEWHLYTFTYDGTNVRFYKDGLLKTSATQSGKLKPITQIFPFYSKAGGANRTTSGCLSDVRVYVTALSDKQVLELYNESAAIDRSGTYYTRELIEQ